MTLEEVVQIAAQGAKQGCAEALFTLGTFCNSWLIAILTKVERIL